jgi:hypothetical protein
MQATTSDHALHAYQGCAAYLLFNQTHCCLVISTNVLLPLLLLLLLLLLLSCGVCCRC